MKNVKSKPFIIGLTGGIATGKSTAANIFKANGFKVIDSDVIVKDLYQNKKEMVNNIALAFNLNKNDKNFKKQLSEIVFNDELKLQKLNDIVHPFVYEEINKKIEQYKNEKYIIIDIPLLIEVNYKVDHILLIYTTQETQIKRLMKRDNITYDEALKRVQSQMDIELKRAFANTIINNEISLDNDLNKFIGGLKDA